MFDEQCQRIRRELEPDGWTVTTEDPGTGRVSIVIDHPLSQQYGVSLDASKIDRVERVVDRLLASAEILAIRTAPSSTPNALLVQALRANAKGYGWSADVLRQLSWMLEALDLLTEPETAWLTATGTIRSFRDP